MQTGRLTESYMERDLHIGKGAYADRLTYCQTESLVVQKCTVSADTLLVKEHMQTVRLTY
jgi:hypothetical protein